MVIGGLLAQPVRWLIKKTEYRRVMRARAEADRLAVVTGKKQLVIILRGRPAVISKQNIKLMVRQHRFNKGVTAADIEKIAIYKT
jgi:hypothetical protein